MAIDLRPTAKRHLAQWRVKWLVEHSAPYKFRKLSGWCIDSFEFRNPPLRQAVGDNCYEYRNLNLRAINETTY
jgi:hypothetical protein